MKFNYKKIATVIGSALMIGSTMGMAAAAYPTPYVSGATADAAIVIGNDADTAAAATIQSQLATAYALANAGGTVTATSTVTGGDAVKLERGSDKFSLGEAANAFYSTLDSEEFTKVLADGVYLNANNNKYDYEQKIVPSGSLILNHTQDSSFNDEKPFVGFDIADGKEVLNYTLTFTDVAEGGTAWADIENTDIQLLGKKFFISDVVNVAGYGLQITMLDSANVATVTEGETKTMVIGNKTYEVSIDYVAEPTAGAKTRLLVNGEPTNTLNVGETYQLTDGTFVGIKDIMYAAKESGISKVEFSIGIGKLTLKNNAEVKLNDKDISDFPDANAVSSVVNAYITNTSTALQTIKLAWLLDDDAIVIPGKDLTLPGFSTIKFSMAGFVQPKAEETKLLDDGESLKLTTSIKSGPLSLNLLYVNASDINGLGKSSTKELFSNITGACAGRRCEVTLRDSHSTQFVATWISGQEAETYAFELGSIDDESGKNKTTLKNLATGGSDVVLTEVGDDADVGQMKLTLLRANKNAKNATVTVTASSGAVYLNRIVTKEGLQIQLPYLNASLGYGSPAGNADTEKTWDMNVTEEDSDNNIGAGKSFLVTNSIDATEVCAEPSTITGIKTFETEQSSKQYVGYKESVIGTKVLWNKPTSGLNTLTITYPGDESYGEVYLSEIAASITTGTSTTTTPGSTLGNIIVRDSQVSSVSNKNLLVVGGSCINTVAAKILGSDTPVCGAAFTTLTGVEAGQYLIKTIASPYTTGKVATLVAGYEMQETSKAATDLVNNAATFTMAAGNTYKGTLTTVATAQTATA